MFCISVHLPFCAQGFTYFSIKGYATSDCRSKKTLIRDKDLIKMKLEMWLSNIYFFGRIQPKSKYRNLFDRHLISLHHKCWHSFCSMVHDNLQLEIISLFFSNKQAFLLNSTYIYIYRDVNEYLITRLSLGQTNH